MYHYTAVECGKPDPANRNGSVEYVGTTFGEIATYSCNIGFKLDETQTGRRVVVCLASGEWSDTAPICKRMYKSFFLNYA